MPLSLRAFARLPFMGGAVGETLGRLATTFTVRDIMIPSAGLVCADDEERAGKTKSLGLAYGVCLCHSRK